jgi:hypothetical protein
MGTGTSLVHPPPGFHCFIGVAVTCRGPCNVGPAAMVTSGRNIVKGLRQPEWSDARSVLQVVYALVDTCFPYTIYQRSESNIRLV